MKKLLVLAPLLALVVSLRAQIPVTDAANLANNSLLHAENLAKWIESINHLRTQVDQLNRQIAIQGDLRQWSGNPVEAGAKLTLGGLGQDDLVREYGRGKQVVLRLADSLGSLARTADGSYRAISNVDLNGNLLRRDELTYRRYAVLDARQESSEQVADATQARAQILQAEIATTLEELKAAPTAAESQKLAAKLVALNGQLAEAENLRRREVDAVTLQKVANDARLEQERLAAAESAARDDHLANRRVSAYLGTLRVRRQGAHEK